MGLFSLEKLFGITIRESANDGSDFTNPDADYRRLFLGEDGQLHVKDSAGAVTDIGATSGSVATDAIWDAAGDLAVGTGANTAAKLTLGASGLPLVSNGSTAVWGVPSLYGAKVYNSNVQSINDVTETDLTFDSEEWDVGGFHSTSSNTERLTIPSGGDGYYECWAHVHFNSGGNIGYRYAKFIKNAATEVRSQTLYDGAGVTTRATTRLVHVTLPLVAGDYIRVKAYQDSGGSMNIGSPTLQQQCYIEIRRVGV